MSQTVTLCGQDGKRTISAMVLAELPYELASQTFALQVTYHEGDGDGAAVTEPVTGRRVCPVQAGDMLAASFDPAGAGRIALQRLLDKHGLARVASTLRAATSGEIQ